MSNKKESVRDQVHPNNKDGYATTIRFSKTEKERQDKFCKKHNVTRSGVMRLAISEYLERNGG